MGGEHGSFPAGNDGRESCSLSGLMMILAAARRRSEDIFFFFFFFCLVT
jgi:hypothetical protein